MEALDVYTSLWCVQMLCYVEGYVWFVHIVLFKLVIRQNKSNIFCSKNCIYFALYSPRFPSV